MSWDEEKRLYYDITPAMRQHIRRTRRMMYLGMMIWTVIVFELGYWIGHGW
jgi:hypothetical protein